MFIRKNHRHTRMNLRDELIRLARDNRASAMGRQTRWHGAGYFSKWYSRAIRNRLEPVKKAAKCLKNHLGGLLNYFLHPITNAVTEGDAQDNYDSAQANLAAAKATLLTSELKLSYTKVYASVNGEITNLDISEGAYASTGQQVMALVDRDSYWIAAYFKETQLRHISTGDTAIISLMGNEDLPIPE